MYNPKSMKAEEFICDREINETLKYAEENKGNIELIEQIIEKAKLRKGLNHREASVLLACEIPEKVQQIYDLAEQIKKDFYGNRIVMFAPLYLSNYCVNKCVYCPYHIQNKNMIRKKLTQEEVAAIEVVAILRKTCEVDNTEERRVAWPVAIVWRRLAEVVKTCPHKLANTAVVVLVPHPVILWKVRPSAVLHVVRRSLVVVVLSHRATLNGELIDTTAAHCRRSLRAEDNLLR